MLYLLRYSWTKVAAYDGVLSWRVAQLSISSKHFHNICYRKISKTETLCSPFTIFFGGTACWYRPHLYDQIKKNNMILLTDLVFWIFFGAGESKYVYTLIADMVLGTKWCNQVLSPVFTVLKKLRSIWTILKHQSQHWWILDCILI